MAKISFKVVPHSIRPGQEIVEILLEGKCVGVIYPEPDVGGFKIVSVHIAEMEVEEGFEGEVIDDDGSTSFPRIPALHVTLKPSTWTLTPKGRVYKHVPEPNR